MATILIAFYSLTGNTRRVGEGAASVLAERGHAVKVVEGKLSRPAGFVKCAIMALLGASMPVRELDLGETDFDVVAVGSPVWAFKLSPPSVSLIRRLAEKGVFRGRKVVPFLTCGGSPGRAPAMAVDLISSHQGVPVEPITAVFRGRALSDEDVMAAARRLADAVCS